MFTGIVEELGEVVALESGEDSIRLTLRGPTVTGDAVAGASIAVDGVCLTVVAAVDGVSLTVSAVGAGWFDVSLIPTTLELTTLGRRRIGERVNLEVDVIAKYVERLLEERVE